MFGSFGKIWPGLVAKVCLCWKNPDNKFCARLNLVTMLKGTDENNMIPEIRNTGDMHVV